MLDSELNTSFSHGTLMLAAFEEDSNLPACFWPGWWQLEESIHSVLLLLRNVFTNLKELQSICELSNATVIGCEVHLGWLQLLVLRDAFQAGRLSLAGRPEAELLELCLFLGWL